MHVILHIHLKHHRVRLALVALVALVCLWSFLWAPWGRNGGPVGQQAAELGGAVYVSVPLEALSNCLAMGI